MENLRIENTTKDIKPSNDFNQDFIDLLDRVIEGHNNLVKELEIIKNK